MSQPCLHNWPDFREAEHQPGKYDHSCDDDDENVVIIHDDGYDDQPASDHHIPGRESKL